MKVVQSRAITMKKRVPNDQALVVFQDDLVANFHDQLDRLGEKQTLLADQIQLTVFGVTKRFSDTSEGECGQVRTEQGQRCARQR